MLAPACELREALLRVLTRTADLLDPDGPRRQPGDPLLDAERRTRVMASVLTVAIARVTGDWGDDLRYQAALLIEQLAKLDSTWMLTNLPALLGALLRLVDDLKAPAPPTLEAISAESPLMRAMEQMNRESAIGAAAREVVDAVEVAAAVDPLAAVTAITTLIRKERDTDRGHPLISAEFAEVAWRAARPADATTVMRAVADTIPAQPAFAWQQRFTELMIAAAAADAAAAAARIGARPPLGRRPRRPSWMTRTTTASAPSSLSGRVLSSSSTSPPTAISLSRRLTCALACSFGRRRTSSCCRAPAARVRRVVSSGVR